MGLKVNYHTYPIKLFKLEDIFESTLSQIKMWNKKRTFMQFYVF